MSHDVLIDLVTQKVVETGLPVWPIVVEAEAPRHMISCGVDRGCFLTVYGTVHYYLHRSVVDELANAQLILAAAHSHGSVVGLEGPFTATVNNKPVSLRLHCSCSNVLITLAR